MEADLSRGESAESRSSRVNRSWQQRRWCKRSVPKTLMRIRLIQLILDVALFSITIYLLSSMSPAAPIILIILFASFAIIMCIDAFGQVGGCLLPDLPMFLVALLGFFLFISVAAQTTYLFVSRKISDGFIVALIALCLVAALLFFLDAMTMIMHWRHIYTMKRKCLSCFPGTSTTILYQRSPQEKNDEIFEAERSKSNPIARDISTSFSRGKQRSSHSGFLGYGTSNRVGVGPRRQYVDFQMNTDLEPSSKWVETQTQVIKPAQNTDHQISAIAIVDQKKVQTMSHCPVCAATLDYSPEGICPTFLAMVQSFGIFSCRESLQVQPESPVLIDRATSPESNLGFKETESTVIVAKKPQRVYETHPCPTHGAGLIAQKSGLPSQVTRISFNHCIRKNKRTQTPMCKPILVAERCQNTEINITVSSYCKSVATLTEGCYPCQEIFSEQESIERVEIPKEDNLKRRKMVEEATITEGSRLSEDNFSTKQNSEKFEIGKEDSGEFAETEEIMTPLREGNSLEIQDGIDRQKSYEEVKVENVEINAITNLDDGKTEPKKESISEESSPSKILSSFENRDSVPSTTAEVTSPQASKIPSKEIGRHSPESRKSPSPIQTCKCSQYYYKDVFGRYICSLCSHKYLIKIPQRYTVKPVGDVRCCSCSQAIFHQAPNAGQSKCHRWCKCRCHRHMDSRK